MSSIVKVAAVEHHERRTPEVQFVGPRRGGLVDVTIPPVDPAEDYPIAEVHAYYIPAGMPVPEDGDELPSLPGVLSGSVVAPAEGPAVIAVDGIVPGSKYTVVVATVYGE